METQVGEKFFQFNFQKNLKLSHNPHLPITRSGMHLMQNQQITRRETTGNYGSSCFHVKISSLFSCFCLVWSCFFLMDDQEEKQASVDFHENFLEVRSFTLIEMLCEIVQ